MFLGDYFQNIKATYKNFFFSGISFDSAQVKKNYIFFAIKGNKIDGNNFISSAIHNGAKIIITENIIRFEPVTININQEIIWKNEQEKLQALVYGVREISGMKSGFIQPGESFTWQFSEPGEYTYVDSVVIGRMGKIIVNP